MAGIIPSANEDRLSVKQQQKRISDDDSLEEILEQTADENNLRNAALNEKEQSIITLYRNGYTQAEIAEKTGVTQGYVSSAIKRINSKIENEFMQQIDGTEKLAKYESNWKEYFNNRDFEGMEREYGKIKDKLKELMPIENTLKEARVIENLHMLIKNNGQDFNLTKEQLELANLLT